MARMTMLDRKRRMETQLICIELTSKGTIGIFRYFCNLFFHRSDTGNYIFIILFSLLLVSYFLIFFRTKTVQNIISMVVLSSIIVLGSSFFFPDTRKYMLSLLPSVLEVLLIGISSMILMCNVRDWNDIFHSLTPYLRIITPILCITYLLGGASYWGSMSWGVRILPLALIYYASIKMIDGTWLDKTFCLIACLFTLLGGRQALVILFAALIVVNVYQFFVNKLNKSRLIFSIVILIMIYVVIFHYNDVLIGLRTVVTRLGISSRALDMLLRNRLFDNSNRQGIYNRCWRFIETNGIIPSGIFADRYYLGQSGLEGYFAHNFIIEILLDCGILLGSVILLKLFIDIVKCFLRCDQQYKILYFLMLSWGLARFFVSSSIFIDSSFWVLVGFLHNKNLTHRKEAQT